MNLAHFIAKRISFGGGKSFTSIIVKIAIAAIALSLAIMIVTNAIITGFSNQITDKIVAFWGDIHISDSNINRTFEQIPIDGAYDLMSQLDSVEYLEYEDARRIFGITMESSRKFYKTRGGIESVQGVAMAPGLLRSKNSYNGVILKGVGPEFDWQRMQKYLQQGKTISYTDSSASREILVSKSIADKMDLQLDQKVNMSFIKDGRHTKRQFRVSGIYNTGLEEYDSKFALVDIAMVRQLLGWKDDQVGNIEVLVDHHEDIDIISEYIYLEILPPNLYSETIQDRLSNIFEWLKLQEMNENIILALMVVVGIINMLSVLLILILERSKMIGILKALGAHNWSIRKIFLYNAAYIIGWGVIIGNVLGLGFCFLQKHYGIIALDEKNYYLSVAPIEVQWVAVIIINLVAFLFILAVMILPTILITYINPIKVLRFE